MTTPSAPWREHPRRIDVPLASLVALIVLVWAIQRPVLTFDNFFLIGDDTLPLMSVEKSFWENRFSVLTGTAAIAERGEWFLALALAVFVVALPTLRFIGLIALRVVESAARRRLRWPMLLDKCSMVDVFVLALLVVLAEIGAIASVTPGAGMWFLLAAASLTAIDSWLLYATRDRGH